MKLHQSPSPLEATVMIARSVPFYGQFDVVLEDQEPIRPCTLLEFPQYRQDNGQVADWTLSLGICGTCTEPKFQVADIG